MGRRWRRLDVGAMDASPFLLLSDGACPGRGPELHGTSRPLGGCSWRTAPPPRCPAELQATSVFSVFHLTPGSG